jgi:hypothetical protein
MKKIIDFILFLVFWAPAYCEELFIELKDYLNWLWTQPLIKDSE